MTTVLIANRPMAIAHQHSQYVAGGPASVAQLPARTPRVDKGVAAAAKTLSLDEMIQQLIASGASVTTVLLAQQIYETSQESTKAMKLMQQMRASKDEINQRNDELRDLKAFITGHKDYKSGKIEQHHFRTTFHKFIEQNAWVLERYPKLKKYKGDKDPKAKEFWPDMRATLLRKQSLQIHDDGTLSKKVDGTLVSSYKGEVDEDYPLRGEDFKEQIESNKSAVQKLDSVIELETMQLQQLVQRKQRFVTLASNITDAEHKSRSAIGNNTRV